MKEVLLATKNRHKIEEFSNILEKIGFTVKSLYDFEDMEIDENGSTFEENALIKARTLFNYTGIMSIADDSGLEIEALDNMPGVHSHRWYGELDDATRNQKVLELLKDKENRKAHFYSVIAVVDKDEEKTFIGQLDGEIALEAKGENGFGYDPIFYNPSFGKTNAEFTLEEKNKMSHRSIAIKKALPYFVEKYEKID